MSAHNYSRRKSAVASLHQEQTTLDSPPNFPITPVANPGAFGHSLANFSLAPIQRNQERERQEALESPRDVPAAKAGGKPLPRPLRHKMEQAFGADFSDVRVQEGPEAKQLGAVAYTRGNRLHFQPGQYQPESRKGQELLGHELAHVVQQRAGKVSVPKGRSAPINADAGLEAEADRLGQKAAQGQQAQHFAPAFAAANAPGLAAQPVQRLKEKSLTDHWTDKEVGAYSDKSVTKAQDKFAGGVVNQVDLLTYPPSREVTPDGQTKPGIETGFFKEDKRDGDIGSAAQSIGIQEGDYRLANRAVATSRMAEKVGTNSAVRTEFATHNGKEGTIAEKAKGTPIAEGKDLQLDPSKAYNQPVFNILNNPQQAPALLGDPNKGGMVEGVNGPEEPKVVKNPDGSFTKKDATEQKNYHDYSDPRIQKGMSDLQMLHGLTGQVDGGGRNIFIDDKTGSVQMIDPDASFGSQKSDDPRKMSVQAQKNLPENEQIDGTKNRGLPTVIDAETAKKYKNLKSKDIDAMTKDLLDKEEREATKKRLKVIKKHVNEQVKEGNVVGYERTVKDKLTGVKKPKYKEWGDETYEAQKADTEGSLLGHAVAEYENAGKEEAYNTEQGSFPNIHQETKQEIADRDKAKEQKLADQMKAPPALDLQPLKVANLDQRADKTKQRAANRRNKLQQN